MGPHILLKVPAVHHYEESAAHGQNELRGSRGRLVARDGDIPAVGAAPIWKKLEDLLESGDFRNGHPVPAGGQTGQEDQPLLVGHVLSGVLLALPVASIFHEDAHARQPLAVFIRDGHLERFPGNHPLPARTIAAAHKEEERQQGAKEGTEPRESSVPFHGSFSTVNPM